MFEAAFSNQLAFGSRNRFVQRILFDGES